MHRCLPYAAEDLSSAGWRMLVSPIHFQLLSAGSSMRGAPGPLLLFSAARGASCADKQAATAAIEMQYCIERLFPMPHSYVLQAIFK